MVLMVELRAATEPLLGPGRGVGRLAAVKRRERKSVSFQNQIIHFSIIWWLLPAPFWSFHFLERMNEERKDVMRVDRSTLPA